MKVFFLFCTAFLMTGCSLVMTDDNEAMDVAARWAEAYFNYDFHEAEQFVTPESERWLRFAASNTTEHDLQLVQEDGEAIVDVDDFFTEANDTLRIVQLRVRNFVSATLPADSAHRVEEALFNITTVLRDGKWKVRMEGLPQSEKLSRD
jgi:hypothetical protein